jgi:hypothetical protein
MFRRQGSQGLGEEGRELTNEQPWMPCGQLPNRQLRLSSFIELVPILCLLRLRLWRVRARFAAMNQGGVGSLYRRGPFRADGLLLSDGIGEDVAHTDGSVSGQSLLVCQLGAVSCVEGVGGPRSALDNQHKGLGRQTGVGI